MMQKTIASTVLSMSLLLGACASNQMATGSVSSPIAAQAEDFKVTVAQGAIAGAVLGGVVGALTGNGDSNRIWQGALIGGAAGAAGGYAIAGQKQAYASKEDALNAVAADCETRNQKLTSLLTTTDRVIAQRKTELTMLKAASLDTQAKLNGQNALLAKLEADKVALAQAITSAQQHGQEIDSNIAELKKQFPDDRPSTADQVAGKYHRNAATLAGKQNELFQIIGESSKIGTAS